MTTQNNTILIERIFEAPRDLVWQAWTQPEHLMRWWGPKAFTSPACKIDLRVGGTYHTCMLAPNGTEYWSTGTFIEVSPVERLKFTDSFADSEGNVVSGAYYNMPSDVPMEMTVTVELFDMGDKTRMVLTHGLVEDKGMKDAMTASWQQSFDKMEDTF